MHIRKGGVDAADLLDPLIHQIHKRAAGARHILRQRNRGVRRVLQNQQMQQIPNRHLFFAFQLGRGCAAGNPGGNTGAHRNHSVQIRHTLHHHQSGDDFGKGTGGKLHIRVIGVDQGLGILLVHDGALCGFQLPVGTCQGHLTVQRPAAVENGYTAEGKIRLRCLGILRQIRLRFRERRRIVRDGRTGGILTESAQRQAACRQRKCQQKAKQFFHISP